MRRGSLRYHMSKRGDDPPAVRYHPLSEVTNLHSRAISIKLVIQREHDMLCVVDTGHVLKSMLMCLSKCGP